MNYFYEESLLSILGVSALMVIGLYTLIIRVRFDSAIISLYFDILLEYPLRGNLWNICLKASDHVIIILP